MNLANTSSILYPGIYQGPPTEAQLLYRQPQLTYADDHPGNKIPALRFKFEVTAPRTHAEKPGFTTEATEDTENSRMTL